MSRHEDKILKYMRDWMCDLKRRNNGRGRAVDAIKIRDTRIKRLKELGCPNEAIEILLEFSEQVIRNGRANYNKMSLCKIVKMAKDIYLSTIKRNGKNKPKHSQTQDRASDMDEYAKVVDDVCEEQKFCIEHVKQCARELAEIDKQIEAVKNQIDELENKLDNLKQERNYKDYSMRDFAAKYGIKIEEPNS